MNCVIILTYEIRKTILVLHKKFGRSCAIHFSLTASVRMKRKRPKMADITLLFALCTKRLLSDPASFHL